MNMKIEEWEIRESKKRKCGVNERPTIPPPKPPNGQTSDNGASMTKDKAIAYALKKANENEASSYPAPHWFEECLLKNGYIVVSLSKLQKMEDYYKSIFEV
jgi:hypothetical protein